jgi:hypothetical protein
MPGNAALWAELRASVLVKGGVLLDEFLLIFRHVFQRVNRVRSASRNASAAVDAALRVDIHLRGSFEPGFVLLGVNAVGGADFDAKRVFDASISDYISHDERISTME